MNKSPARWALLLCTVAATASAASLLQDSKAWVLQRVGQIGTTSGYAHLSTSFDLTALEAQAEKIIELVKKFRHKHITTPLARNSSAVIDTYHIRDGENLNNAHEARDRITFVKQLLESASRQNPIHFRRVMRSTSEHSAPQEYKHAMTKQSPVRVKRMAGFLALGIIAALNHGMYQGIELEKLHNQLEAEKGRMDVLAEIVTDQGLKLTHYTKNMEKYLYDFEEAMAKQEVRHSTLELSTVVNRFNNEIKDWANSIAALQQGTFLPDLVRYSYLVKAFRNLKNLVSNKNHHLLDPSLNSLTSIKTTLYTSGNMVNIVLHLPVFTMPMLQIYRYHPIPFVLSDELMAVVESPKEILAINDDQTLFKELSLHEFSSCTQFQDTYHCANDNLILKDPTQSCAMAILHNSRERIQAVCEVRVTTKQRLIAQLGPRTYAYRFRKHEDVLLQCPGEGTGRLSRKIEKVSEPHGTITVPANCTATSESFFVDAEDPISLSADILNVPIRDEDIDAWFNTEFSLGDLRSFYNVSQVPVEQDLKSIQQWQRFHSIKAKEVNVTKVVNAFKERVKSVMPDPFSFVSGLFSWYDTLMNVLYGLAIALAVGVFMYFFLSCGCYKIIPVCCSLKTSLARSVSKRIETITKRVTPSNRAQDPENPPAARPSAPAYAELFQHVEDEEREEIFRALNQIRNRP